MWLGTRRGPVWSALRRVFIRDVLLRPGMSERVAARFAMLSLVDLSRRQMLPELMDAADADPVKLSRTYRQFRLINRVVSRYRTILRRYVLDDMAREPNRVYRLVDIGAGGCEIAVWLLREARRRGLRLTVTAIDVDPRAVTFSQSRYGAVPGLEIREMDAFQIEQLGPVDYVFSNHVLHHLPDAQIVALLRVLQRNVRRRIVCSDLERNQFSYTVFSLLTRPLLRRSFARVDGLLSIRKGFVGHELAELATKAEIKAEVQRMCPGRVVLVCEGNLKVVRPLGLEPRTR